MSTFTIAALDTPIDVVDYTATDETIVQVTIDTTNLAANDTLNIKMSDNTTGNMIIVENEDFITNPTAPAIKTYMVGLSTGQRFKIIAEQTSGTARSFNYFLWASVRG
jgi:hypothetical protein